MGKFKYKPVNVTNHEYIKITIDSVKEFYNSKDSTGYRRIYKDSTGVGPSVEFLEIVERGPISLYLQFTRNGRADGYMSSEQWYITKNSDTAKLLKTSGLSLYEIKRQTKK